MRMIRDFTMAYQTKIEARSLPGGSVHPSRIRTTRPDSIASRPANQFDVIELIHP